MRTLFAGNGARLAACCTGIALIGAVPVALGADAADLRSQADRLRDRASSFGTQRSPALLNLYALESELDSARTAVASLDARRTTLAREHASTRRRLAVAKRAAAVSHRRLEQLLRKLYADGGVDPLAIVLGSASLDEALTGLETLERAAAANRRILDRARATRVHLIRVDARLTAREAELDRLARAARTRAAELEAAAAARAAYVATLRRRQDLTTRAVASLEAQARAAQQQAAQIQPTLQLQVADPASTTLSTPPATPLETAVATDGARTLAVTAIGYSLRGRTASGLAVGHGIAAVDPSVIPFGTRMYVPGYGEAVAADAGSAIRGNMIDLWFPTTAAAYRWGRRTVVVTLR